LNVAVDFVNTRSEPTGDDSLSSAADLARFLDAYRDLAAAQDDPASVGVDLVAVAELFAAALARWEPTEADLRDLRDLRARLRAVFDNAAADPPGAVVVLNEQLRTYRALPRISDQHGAPHLHFEAAEDGLVHWLAVTVLMGLVLFVCDGHAARLGSCASASCRRAFIDRSKNGSKTYCSDTCAHRESVIAYRARQRARRS
jgi:predicted RNA-binding Zn ribbon-like protein